MLHRQTGFSRLAECALQRLGMRTIGICALARGQGMNEVFATARMYRRGVSDLPIGGIFGVATFELG